MNNNLKNIVDQLKNLTLLEISNLIKEIEITFNIDISASANKTQIDSLVVSAPIVEAIEEKTSFNITLSEVPADKKIAILKIIRNVTGLGIKESKEIVDNIPKTIKEGITKEESESIKKEIEALGGKVVIN